MAELMDYAPTYIDGATTGQLVVTALIAGFVAGATMGLVFFLLQRWAERGIDRAYGDEWWDKEHTPLPDATDDPEAEHSEPFVAQQGDRFTFASTRTGVAHRLDCRFATEQATDAIWSGKDVADAADIAEALRLSPCGACHPFELHPIDEAAQKQEAADA